MKTNLTFVLKTLTLNQYPTREKANFTKREVFILASKQAALGTYNFLLSCQPVMEYLVGGRVFVFTVHHWEQIINYLNFGVCL